MTGLRIALAVDKTIAHTFLRYHTRNDQNVHRVINQTDVVLLPSSSLHDQSCEVCHKKIISITPFIKSTSPCRLRSALRKGNGKISAMRVKKQIKIEFFCVAAKFLSCLARLKVVIIINIYTSTRECTVSSARYHRELSDAISCLSSRINSVDKKIINRLRDYTQSAIASLMLALQAQKVGCISEILK